MAASPSDQLYSSPLYGDAKTEPFHQHGHHVQKAHGRRAQLASDGSHLSGAMIALVPTATDAKRLAVKGGEAPEDLHLTLFYLGKAYLEAKQLDKMQTTLSRLIREYPSSKYLADARKLLADRL